MTEGHATSIPYVKKSSKTKYQYGIDRVRSLKSKPSLSNWLTIDKKRKLLIFLFCVSLALNITKRVLRSIGIRKNGLILYNSNNFRLNIPYSYNART